MSASLGLYRLQQIDSQIERARTKQDAIQKTLENDAELREGLDRVTNAQADRQLAHNELRKATAEVEAQKAKITQTEASLYGGGVKNPKELQDLQKDSASLKKHFATLDERELDAMIKSESADNDLQIATTELELMQARLGNEHKHLMTDQSDLLKELERLAEEREAALGPIESNLLQSYEDLRQQKRGVAVTQAVDNACTSCGTILSASLQQTARSQKQLAYCSSCGRIIYAN